MTYIQYVNQVLVRLREAKVTQLAGTQDNVVALVAALVNDARAQVFNAHNWNALRTSYTASVSPSNDIASIANSGSYIKIDRVEGADGRELKLRSVAELQHLAAHTSGTGIPQYYAPYGTDGSGQLRLLLSPEPAAAEALVVSGYQPFSDLVNDDDTDLLPSRAVYLLAYAMAAAERGEVGGQPSAELFAMAQKELADAVALDASLNSLDDIWYS